MGYQYTPLVGQENIRLLRVWPASPTAVIRISLHHTTLTDTEVPFYEALSYTWGSTADSVTVEVVDSGGAEVLGSLLVTQNLALALQHLRHHSTPRVVWADAICINQNDDVERSHQVANMAQVYRSAHRVRAFLGVESEQSTLAFEIFDRISTMVQVNFSSGEVKSSTKAHSTAETQWANMSSELRLTKAEFLAIQHLLNHDWFSRLWIRQEIGLAGARGVLLCGQQELLWSDFCQGIFVLKRKPVPDDLQTLHPRFRQSVDAADDVALFSRRGFSLLGLRQQTQFANCSDPRDKIYGLLSQLRGAHSLLGILPDYTKSTAEVYKDVTEKYMAHFKNLLILNQCDGARTGFDLPSWVPDWSRPLVKSHIHTVPPRILDLAAQFAIVEGSILQSSGVLCGTVQHVEAFDNEAMSSTIDSLTTKEIRRVYNTARACGDSYKTGESVLEAYCCTLCVDDLPERWHPLSSTLLCYRLCVDLIERIVGVKMGDEQVRLTSREKGYLGKVRDACRSRSFFTTKEGYMGLAPEATRPGDKLVFLFGCNTPVVLRPLDETQVERYSLIGNCYAHGLMQGQVILGELPTYVREALNSDSVTGIRVVGFLDRKSTEAGVLTDDPRMRRFLGYLVEKGLLDSPDLAQLEKKDTLRTLKQAGFPIKTFDIR